MAVLRGPAVPAIDCLGSHGGLVLGDMSGAGGGRGRRNYLVRALVGSKALGIGLGQGEGYGLWAGGGEGGRLQVLAGHLQAYWRAALFRGHRNALCLCSFSALRSTT